MYNLLGPIPWLSQSDLRLQKESGVWNHAGGMPMLPTSFTGTPYTLNQNHV